MSGHSKWKNIMHKKEKTDAQKAKVFTKIGKEIQIAVRAGGPDPVSNTKLRDLIQKAKSLNVPNDNIERTIKKASGADAYLTGELGHHLLTDANDHKIVLFEAGHHYTEFPVCNVLEKIINGAFTDITTEIYNSIAIKTI